jgi:hypothetical protein
MGSPQDLVYLPWENWGRGILITRNPIVFQCFRMNAEAFCNVSLLMFQQSPMRAKQSYYFAIVWNDV